MELDDPGLENRFMRMVPVAPEHKQAVYDSGTVDALWKWMPVLTLGTSYDSYFDHVVANAKKGSIVPFSMFATGTDEFLGVAAYQDPNRIHRRLQIAHIWLTEEARGKSYFIAAQSLMIQRALDWGARRIVWMADERNEPAIGAFKKLGASIEGVARSYQRMNDGHWADMVVFSLLRSEARAVIKTLEAKLAGVAPAE